MISNRKVFKELIEDLKSANFIAEKKVAGEGRGGSLKDENNIINWLLKHPKWGSRVEETKARRFGDFILDGIYYINIKTDEFNKNPRPGGGCNVFSKCGFAYALSNATVEEIGGSMNLTKFTNFINSCNVDNNRDYLFLCFNKLNMQEIFIRGAKEINHYYGNPSNFLQVNLPWEYINEPVDRSFTEAKEFILSTLKGSIEKKHKDENYFLNGIKL